MLRSAFGAIVAVLAVVAGIAGLQALVPSRDRGSPSVVRTPDAPVVVPPPTATVRPSVSPPPTTTPPVAERPALTVLNNSRVTGLAKKAAADFARAGWPTAATGNMTGRLAVTTVYYEPGQEAAAAALRAAFPDIRAAAPRYAALPGHGLTVVVTRDYPH